MATAEENARGNGRRPRKRGNGTGATTTGGRLSGAFGTPDDTQMEWADIDPRYPMWVLAAITALGGAVTYGRSRDGGALMVALLLDGERETKWISPRDDAEAVLTQMAERLEALH